MNLSISIELPDEAPLHEVHMALLIAGQQAAINVLQAGHLRIDEQRELALPGTDDTFQLFRSE